MSPKEYIAARGQDAESNTTYRVQVDGRPHFPRLKVDAADELSVKRVVASLLLGADTDEKTDNSNNWKGGLLAEEVKGAIPNALFHVSGIHQCPTVLKKDCMTFYVNTTVNTQ